MANTIIRSVQNVDDYQPVFAEVAHNDDQDKNDTDLTMKWWMLI